MSLSYLPDWGIYKQNVQSFLFRGNHALNPIASHSVLKGGLLHIWINVCASYVRKFMLQLCKAALIYFHPSSAPTLSPSPNNDSLFIAPLR